MYLSKAGSGMKDIKKTKISFPDIRINIQQMRQFYSIWQKASAKLQPKGQSDQIIQKTSEQFKYDEYCISRIIQKASAKFIRLNHGIVH